MPPSQLKQLKASLRENCILGPQQSKKKRRQNAKTGASAQTRIQRNTALQAIRDQFNPFEVRPASQRVKFDVTTRDAKVEGAARRVRPSLTRSLGEEKRRNTLLKEMYERHKVGGIVDRRFGENDPTMTPEERAAARFARESQRKLQKESLFNLEDEEDEVQLTHGGQALSFDALGQDDFRDDLGEEEDDMGGEEVSRKRKSRFGADEKIEDFAEDDDEEGQPERKKTKNEVMKEVIAKSKFYKYERQKAKEEDDDLREEIDKELPDLFTILRGVPPPSKPELANKDLGSMNPERAALMDGSLKRDADKEYDQRLKQMTFDKRSKPTDRTKTEEEKAEEEAERLKTLEETRLRRMHGQSDDDEEDKGDQDAGSHDFSDDDSVPDDAMAFGLRQTTPRLDLGVEDEDDFIIDEDLVETRSDVSLSFIQGDEEGLSLGDSEVSDENGGKFEEDDELINGLTLPGEEAGVITAETNAVENSKDGLAFTYPCPEDHEQFLEITKNVPLETLHTVIQRIRALHHPRLHSDNKSKLGRFATILVEHVAFLANQPQHPPFGVLESILRHIHSMAKGYPDKVAAAFRAQLREMSADRPLNLTPGDLIVLTGIATIFPTSDHFHTVSTPAHLALARYLGQAPVDSLAQVVSGAYAASLCLQYQTISKRYMPEVVNYLLNTICNLSPAEPKQKLGLFPSRASSQPQLRVSAVPKGTTFRKIRFWDILGVSCADDEAEIKLSLLATVISLVDYASDLWSSKSAFSEIFGPARHVVQHLHTSCKAAKIEFPAELADSLQATLDKLDSRLSDARLKRRPLLLHNHRPLAIKTSIPKFEENFNPDKHYDPDRERAEAMRLKKDYKRERKGAMRELRRDANFMAREQLRQKKERDAEYEKKYKRLVAEIQNEEGREANAYERAKRLRGGKR